MGDTGWCIRCKEEQDDYIDSYLEEYEYGKEGLCYKCALEKIDRLQEKLNKIRAIVTAIINEEDLDKYF